MPNLKHPAINKLYELFGKRFHNPVWIQDADTFNIWTNKFDCIYFNTNKLISLWIAKSNFKQYNEYLRMATATLEGLISLLNILSDNNLSAISPQLYAYTNMPAVEIGFENGKIIYHVDEEISASIEETFKLDKLQEDIALALVDETKKKDKLLDIYFIVSDIYLKLLTLKVELLEVKTLDYQYFKEESISAYMNALSTILEGYYLFDVQFINLDLLSPQLFELRYNFNLPKAILLIEFLCDRYTLVCGLYNGILDKKVLTEAQVNNFVAKLEDSKNYPGLLKKEAIALRAIGILNILKISNSDEIKKSKMMKNITNFIVNITYAKAVFYCLHEANPAAELALIDAPVFNLLPEFFNITAIMQAYTATEKLAEKMLALEQFYLDLASVTMSMLVLLNQGSREKFSFNPLQQTYIKLSREHCKGFDFDVATGGPWGSRIQSIPTITSFHRSRLFSKYILIGRVSEIIGAATRFGLSDAVEPPAQLIQLMDKLFALLEYLKNQCLHEEAAKKIFVPAQEYRLDLLKDSLENSPCNGIFNNKLILARILELENKNTTRALNYYEQTGSIVKTFSMMLSVVFTQLDAQKVTAHMVSIEADLQATLKTLPRAELVNIEILSSYIKLMFLGKHDINFYKSEFTRYCSHVYTAFLNCFDYERRYVDEINRKNLLYYSLEEIRILKKPTRSSALKEILAPAIEVMDSVDELVQKVKDKSLLEGKPQIKDATVLNILTKLTQTIEAQKSKVKASAKAEEKPQANFKILYKKAKQPLKKLKKRIEELHTKYLEIKEKNESENVVSAVTLDKFREYAERLAMIEAEVADLQASFPTLEKFSQAADTQRDLVRQREDRLKSQIELLDQELTSLVIKKPKQTSATAVVKPDFSEIYLRMTESLKDLKQHYEKSSKTLRALDAAGKASQVRYPDYENRLAELKKDVDDLSSVFPAKEVFEKTEATTRDELAAKLASCTTLLIKLSGEMSFTLTKASKIVSKTNAYQKSLGKKEKQAQKEVEPKIQQIESKGEEKKGDNIATTPTSKKTLSIKTTFTFLPPKPSAPTLPVIKKSNAVEDAAKNTRALLLNQVFAALMSINKLASAIPARPNILHYAMLYNIQRAYAALQQYKKLGSQSLAENDDARKNVTLLLNLPESSPISQDENIKNLILEISRNIPDQFNAIENPMQFEFCTEDRQKLVSAFSLAEERMINRYMIAEFPLIIDDRIAIYNLLSKFFKQEALPPVDHKVRLTRYIAIINDILFDKSHTADSLDKPLFERFVFDIQALRMLMTLCVELSAELTLGDKKLREFVYKAKVLLAESNSLESYAPANENGAGGFITQLLFAVETFYTPLKVNFAEEKEDFDIAEMHTADFRLEQEYFPNNLEPVTQSSRMLTLTPDPVYAQDFLVLACQCLLQIAQNPNKKQNYFHATATTNSLLLNIFLCFQALNEFYKLKGLPHCNAFEMGIHLRSMIMAFSYGWNDQSKRLKDYTQLLNFTLPRPLVLRAECWYPDLDEKEIELLLNAFCFPHTSQPEEFTHQAPLAILYERLLKLFNRLYYSEPKSAASGLLNMNLLAMRTILQDVDFNRFSQPSFFLDYYGAQARAIRLMLIACAQLAPDIIKPEPSLSAFLTVCQAELKKVLLPHQNLEPSPQETFALIIYLATTINTVIENTSKRFEKNRGVFFKQKPVKNQSSTTDRNQHSRHARSFKS